MPSSKIGWKRKRHVSPSSSTPEITHLLLAWSEGDQSALEMLPLDAALIRLSAIDARMGKVVELRFFGGLSVEETAVALRLSSVTVMREWKMAKAWLYQIS